MQGRLNEDRPNAFVQKPVAPEELREGLRAVRQGAGGLEPPPPSGAGG